MREKFVPHRVYNLIIRNSSFGPIFGGGFDIRISDGCNSNNESHTTFPQTYNRPNQTGSSLLDMNGDTYRMFAGDFRFRVREY